MNIDILGLNPFTSSVLSHKVLKIKGFSFLIVNPLALGQKDPYGEIYTYDYFNTGIRNLGRKTARQSLENYFLGYFDINSTNEEYLSEVNKLKNTFNVRINSLFKCRKYRFIHTVNYEDYPFEIFMFQFDDIFDTFEIYTRSFYVSNLDAGMGYYRPFDNVPAYSLDSTHRFYDDQRNGYYQFRFFENAIIPEPYIGIPVYKNFDTNNVYGVSFGFELFFKDDIYYLFALSKIPRMDSQGVNAIVVYDLYKIELKKILCCLAECFGITE
jgi:hypothetical protein